MAKFHFSAVSNTGQRASGTREAKDESELARALREEGFILTLARPERSYSESFLSFKKILDAFNIFGRVSLAEKMMFTRQLSVMIKAGFSLNKGLQVLSLQTKNRSFAKILNDLEEQVRKGTAFGDALSKYPEIFSDLFINMVKVGESSGNLEGNLKLLAIQMKKDYDIRSKVKSAMIYPAVILIAMLGIGAGMMIFVVPRLISIFEEMELQLPLTTRIVIATSKFLSNNWFLCIIVLLGAIIFFRLALRTNQGKRRLDQLILISPIFGNISKKMNSARMARTLSSLVESAVPIVRALEIVAGTLTNTLFQESLIVASRDVQKGRALSEVLVSFPKLYPPMVVQMIQVGEETGTFGEISKRLAEFYEEEVSTITKGLSSIIEPILMIIIGAAVGLFAVSMLQPMYSMMSAI